MCNGDPEIILETSVFTSSEVIIKESILRNREQGDKVSNTMKKVHYQRLIFHCQDLICSLLCGLSTSV